MRHRVLFTAIIIAIALCATGICQDTPDNEEVSVVYLTSRAVLRGTIIEDISDDRIILIMQSDSSRVEVPYDKIFRITDEAGLEAVREQFRSLSPKSTGFHHPEVEGKIGLMGASDSDLLFVADVVTGYHIGELVFGGIGIGIMAGENGALPIHATVRMALVETSLSPYVFFDGGYVIGTAEPGDMTGLLFGGGLGCILTLSENYKLVAQGGIHSFKSDFGENANFYGVTAGISRPFRNR